MKKCVIIGSGLGGLSTGVVLAKNGYEVTILEQSAQIGGCLQCFWRDGVKFETGMHIVGSLDDGQVLSNYFNYLEIKDKIELQRLNTEGYDIVSLRGEKFAFPNGRKAFIEHFVERFPSQRENLERYFDLVEKMASVSPFYDLSKTNDKSFFDGDLFVKSVNEVIEQTITDPLLREVLVGNLTLYAGEWDKTPFATHAFIADLYNKSTFRVVGGSDCIAKALVEVLQSYSGRIITCQKVEKILVRNNVATGVITNKGETFPADVVVSDIHPKQLITLVDNYVFSEKYVNRIKNLPDTTSIFSLYLRFKDDTVPYLNHNFYKSLRNSFWEVNGEVDANWPSGYYYYHHCHQKNIHYAKGGVVIAYMSMNALKSWEDTALERRSLDYEEFKKSLAERLLDAVEEDFPGIRDSIASYYVATPLTYRDYTLTPNGAIYGLSRDLSLGIEGRVKYKTRVPNLFLVGQNIIAHGILGVLSGTMIVCRHLIGEREMLHQVIEANRKSVAIIGGGIGGLVSGALLAREGYKVTVLEKNCIVGGGLQSFKRNGCVFPTGMHVTGGFGVDGPLRKLFSYLGIMDKLSFRPMDKDANDVVIMADGSAEYRFPQGPEHYIEYISTLFPDEKDGIKAYVEKISDLAKEDSLFYLQEASNQKYDHSNDFYGSFDSLINRYICNPQLRLLLHYLSPMFGGEAGSTPAFVNALTSMLHINGICQFVGGSQQLADLLAGVIEKSGGSVLTERKVVAVKVKDREVTELLTQDGTPYRANSYICDIHPDLLLDIIDKNAFTKAYVSRLRQIEESVSCFKVFVEFKDHSFPYLNQQHFLVNDLTKCLDMKSIKPEEWPQGIMFVTPPQEKQDTFASTMVINCYMDYDWVKPWENTRVGNRGEAYEEWKQLNIGKVLALMGKAYPNFHDCIKSVFASSPLTIRDYLGNKKGGIYGYKRDCNNLVASQLSVFTKVRNLFLTGQDVNLHGLCGVSLTAIETAEAIVGHNVIVRKINENYKNKKD